MKKNNTLIYAGVAVAGFLLFRLLNKLQLANTIVSTGNHGSVQTLIRSFGANFLRPWAEAAKAGQRSFVFDGRTFNTKGGRRIS